MEDVQFDKAEFAGPGAAVPAVCFACQESLTGPYFQVNGEPFCETCTDGAQRALGGTPGPDGFAKAVIGGIGGGIAGAMLYYLVLALSGYEVGLVAVAVGFLVGKGVRWGTGGRGGRVYQVMAIGLTYIAIVSTYVPTVVRGFRDAEKARTTASSPVEGTDTSAATPAAATTRATTDGSPGSTVGLVIGLALFAVLILALPFLGGFSNILGLAIIGFGLYEAWKLNRRVPLIVDGPFAAMPALPSPVPSVPGV